MKKVTIIMLPEYDGLVLEALGEAGVTQLKAVTGSEFANLEISHGEKIDFKKLYDRLHSRYTNLLDRIEMPVEPEKPDVEQIRSFTLNPDQEIENLLGTLDKLTTQFELKKEEQHNAGNSLVGELQAEIEQLNQVYENQNQQILEKLKQTESMKKEVESDFLTLKARIESIQALEPDEFKRCFAVGIVNNELVPKLQEYLSRYEDLFYRTVDISDEQSFLFVFGPEEGRKWVSALFLVFDIKDVFDVLDPRDVLLVLDPEKRQEAIEKYQSQLDRFEQSLEPQSHSQEEKELLEEQNKLKTKNIQDTSELKTKYDEKIAESQLKYEEEIKNFKNEQKEILGTIDYYDHLLRIYSDRRAPVLRGKVISVIQGWTPENKLNVLQKSFRALEKRLGETLFIEVEDVDIEEDSSAPSQPTEFKPAFLQPLWTLTSLRGWPSAGELNPGYISVIIFCFQFGLMFGDIGQGAIFLIVGLFLANKYDRGLMNKLGGLFVPMGIAAIIFGFLYDSIFLVEGLLFHHHQVMPNPIHNTSQLMKLVFLIAVIEVIIGLVLGAYNQIKMGNYVGALGEHGLGMILYVVGLYLSAMFFINSGMNFMPVLSNWTFYLMLVGMGLSFMEPILHSIQHGHGIGMESIGEGVGGLLMTFVEGLANLFSFLRIAAFALAHASLGVAAVALTNSLGIAGIGLIIMNVVALSFEFVSSSVQSLRLLYYEFMGKFYSGQGTPFRPFYLQRAEKYKLPET
jgi:vacuolar-type H+-ATPase subunit I/STV1